ncbi:hypothetical protein AKO1_004373, partial [Acrasis kona]
MSLNTNTKQKKPFKAAPVNPSFNVAPQPMWPFAQPQTTPTVQPQYTASWNAIPKKPQPPKQPQSVQKPTQSSQPSLPSSSSTNYPATLQKFVEISIASATPETEQQIQNHLRYVIVKAQREGTIFTHNWQAETLPPHIIKKINKAKQQTVPIAQPPPAESQIQQMYPGYNFNGETQQPTTATPSFKKFSIQKQANAVQKAQQDQQAKQVRDQLMQMELQQQQEEYQNNLFSKKRPFSALNSDNIEQETPLSKKKQKQL